VAAQIEAVSSVTPELVEAFARLLPQQSPGARHPTAEQLRAIAEQPGTTLLIARDDRGAIVGTLTLIIMLTPGATFGFVEDVVVDTAARRQGIGEALVRECLRFADEQGASRVELHSGNHRPDAIRLYQRVGFRKFETNVWRFVPDTPA
jgi:ribosomal protein S18 acetylase RimI-like enzyme